MPEPPDMSNVETLSDETSVTILAPINPTSGQLDGYLFVNSTNGGYSTGGILGLDENLKVQGLEPGSTYNLSFVGVSCNGTKSASSSVKENICTSNFIDKKKRTPNKL